MSIWKPSPYWARVLQDRSAAVLANLVVLSATTNLTVIMVSSLIEVEQSSIWFACVSASALLFVADMGISYALSRYLAIVRGAMVRGALGGHVRIIVLHFIRIAWVPFVVLSIALGVYLLLAWDKAGTAHRTGVLVGLWVLVSGYTFLAVLSKFLQMANEGLGKLADERFIVSACQGVMFVAVAVLLVAFRSILVVPIVYLAGFAVQAALLYRLARRAGSSVAIDPAGLSMLSRESRGLWFLNLATVTSQNVQVMSLAFLATPASVASFFFLQRLCGGASNLLGIIPIIDRARITAHVDGGEFAMARRVIRRNLAIAATAAVCVTVLFVCGVTVIGWFGWLRFRIPPLLVALFAFDLSFSSVLGILGQYLLSAGRNPLIPWTIACSVLTIGLQFVMVPSYGVYGAIMAFLVAQVLTTYGANLFHFTRLMRDLRGPSDEHG